MNEKSNNRTGKNQVNGGKLFLSNLSLVPYIQAARTTNTQQNNGHHSGQISYKQTSWLLRRKVIHWTNTEPDAIDRKWI